ncbi:MAG: hypothetical protein C0613_14815 [Desulfobulbaceae bacterium]|nr:MAG: hypothetical protein C0613_14815 [Desulfobulbaceae bacterium]
MPDIKKISATSPAARTGFATTLAILFTLACLYLTTILVLSFAELRDESRPPHAATAADPAARHDREDSHAH